MYAYFHDETYIYQVLEYAANNSLFSILRRDNIFSEEQTAKVNIL